MKKKAKEELKNKSVAELAEEVVKRVGELGLLRMEIKMGKAKNTSLLRRRLDELAVVKTIKKEKELVKVDQRGQV